MKSVLHPWQILLFILAGWVNRHQQNTIEYLVAENHQEAPPPRSAH
jgi:putative transposase